MAQLFPSTANTLARVSLFGAVALPVLLIVASSAITRSSANTKVDVPLDQPVPFSHEHHVNELGIDCRYCHTSVEKSATAGVPPTQTCMSCHSQIWTNSPLLEPIRQSYRSEQPIKSWDGSTGWTRVNKVPEFVYFNHSIHINRGINCNVCHGPVQKMQLTYKGNTFFMSWCVECHRNPEKALYRDPESDKEGLSQREQVFNLYTKAQKGEEHLSARERAIADGTDFGHYHPSADEVKEGEKLVDKYHVKVKQLTDCWTCHR
jgi:hypothetical protein